MTGTGDESDANEDGETDDRPAGGRSDSRFEKFFDRLGRDDDDRQPSPGEEGAAEPSDSTASEGDVERDQGQDRDRNRDRKQADTDRTDDERETDADASRESPERDEDVGEYTSDDAGDGWVWGDPRPTASGDRKRDDPNQARIWNREAGAPTDASADDSGSSPDPGTEPGAKPPTDRSAEFGTDRPADEPGDTGRAPATDDRAPESDRWSRLGSTLGSTSGGKQPDGNPRDAPDPETRAQETSAPNPSDGSEGAAPDAWSGTGSGSEPDIDIDVDSPDFDRTQDLDRLASSPSVLLLGPTDGSVSDALCSRFLTDAGKEESRDVIFVTFREPPDERVDVCHRADGWAGGNIGVIEVGRGSRNAAVSSEITGTGSSGSISVRHVSRPGDLSKLGIVITQLLSEFDDTGRRTVLCFHTVSDLHRQVGTKTLFRFLNTLQGRLNAADALGHYHMNPDLHDEIVVETLRPIFDSIVRYSAEGDLAIE